MLKIVLAFIIFFQYSFSSSIDNKIIASKHLGYNVRYSVYVPKGMTDSMPVLYVTDGKGYKANGLVKVSERLIRKGKVIPHIIVMVDAIDPDDPSINHRNSEFQCNPDYLNFYKEELIPSVDKEYNLNTPRDQRGILGLSFGGLNALYFALHGSDVFGKIGVQSPATHPCPTIYADFKNSPILPIDIFLSTGIKSDKAYETRKFKRILDSKGYNFKYIEVNEGHTWANWAPLFDDILEYFYGVVP